MYEQAGRNTSDKFWDRTKSEMNRKRNKIKKSIYQKQQRTCYRQKIVMEELQVKKMIMLEIAKSR